MAKASIPADDNSTQVKELQGENILSLSFTLYEHVVLEVNDHVDFQGERYWLMEQYKPEQASTVEWKYDLKMYGIESLLRRFLVLNDTDGADEAVFTLTAPPREHVALIVKSINEGMGTTDWKVGEVEGTDNIVVDYHGKFCDEALKEVAEKAGNRAEWWMDGLTVNICYCLRGEEVTLGYGKGLTSLGCDMADNVPFYTRLYPLGSSRNIDPERYGHPRLQLPGGVKHVDVNVEKYGVWHRYEADAFADIYPKYTGTVSSVRSEEATGEDGNPYKIYYFKDDGLPFDPNEYEIGGKVKRVSFQEGSELAGVGNEEDGTYYLEANFHSDTREWEIITIWPFDDDTQLPNDTLCPKAGDKYIPWNFRMPDEYYPLAEQEFKEAVDAYNEANALDVARYKGPTDHVYVEENGIDLFLGRAVRLESDKYFPETGSRVSRITKITRKVNLPSQMDLEISDAVSIGTRESINDSITDVKNYVRESSGNFPDIVRSWENTPASDYNVASYKLTMKQIVERALSRLTDDQAHGLITFLSGAVFGKDGFASGLTGFGAKIDEYGNGEMESLFVRRKLVVPLLVYNRTEIQMGDKWRAPGVGVIDSVDTENKICTLRLEDGEIGAVAVGDICMGIYHSMNSGDNATEDYDDSLGNRKFAGFCTVYFTVTEVMGDRNGQFRYQVRPVSERWTTTYDPFGQMTFVAYGSFTREDRQTSVYETRTYTRMLWKQNTWEISAGNIALQYGDLTNLNVHGMQMAGYSMYLNNVYFTGTILQTKPDGTPIRTANDRGAWPPEDNHADFYDRFSYNGSLWLCVNEDGTSTAPAEDNPDWLKQVEKGDTGEPGKSVRYLGRWYTGLFVSYLGIVRMGRGSYMCIVEAGTTNPPLWTLTDKDGNRILQTQDGGQTYGYILTGEMNTAEYALVAEDGTDGVGIPGKDGKTYYTWIRYADDAQGTGISNDPTGKAYIGISNNNETAAESDDPADYTWSLIKGTDGVGIPGKDGKTYYTWIAYSDNPDGSGMYQQPTDSTKYIGIAPNKETATESTNPSDYVWSKFKGEDGQSPQMLGDWKTGLFVPYLGIVRMGGASWCCKNTAGTTNPPLWTLTDKDGNRLLQTQDGGKTYGYILTGEKNTGEYELVAEDGTNGQDGQDGTPGLQGCILRRSEWKTGTEYRNDESLTSGTRYIDVALIRDSNTATGWRAYKCKATHTSSASNAPGNTSYWEEFGVNTTSIYTDVIIAKNASIDLMWGQQVVVTDENHNPQAGLTSRGIGTNTNVRIFAGTIVNSTAPFMVMADGSFTSTKATITGTIYATGGTIAGFSISGNSLTNVGFNNNAAVIFRNDNTKCFAGIGGNVFPATTGITCVGRFENCDTSDTWAWSKNVALYLRAEGATYNYAFMGTGNGVLNGLMEGFALQYVISTGSTVMSTDVSKGKYVEFYITSGTFSHLLPTRLNIQDALGIGSADKFAVLLHYFTKYTAGGSVFLYGRTTDITGADTEQYPYLYDQNGNNIRKQLAKGDSARVLVAYDGYNYFAQLI